MPKNQDNYIELEVPEMIEIEFEGPPLDAYGLGLLNLALHNICNRVALAAWHFPPGIYPSIRNFRGPYFPHYLYDSPSISLVSLKVQKLASGSLQEIVTLVIASIYSDAGARAILQNLAANVIWAIGKAGFRRSVFSSGTSQASDAEEITDPYDIGPELGHTIRHIAASNRGQSCRLKFKTKRPDGRSDQVDIYIGDEDE